MVLDVGIVGGARLHEIAKSIRATGDKGLGRQMTRALAKAVQPIQREIDVEAARVMPVRGGYQALLAKSLRHRMSQRTGSRNASVRLLTFADGTQERRDVERLNKGELRHPVFGRSRTVRSRGRVPNPWTVTKIRPGFHERGTKDAGDEAVRELGAVLDDFAERLAKG